MSKHKRAQQVRNEVDIIVEGTGYPVLGKIIIDSSLADRELLRWMERRGHLIEVTVKHNNGKQAGTGSIYKAYHTERVIPEWVIKQQEEREKETATED